MLVAHAVICRNEDASCTRERAYSCWRENQEGVQARRTYEVYTKLKSTITATATATNGIFTTSTKTAAAAAAAATRLLLLGLLLGLT